MTVLIGIAFKSLLIAALTLGLLELMKRRSAAERSWIAHAGLFALVLMAVAPLAMPNWTVEGRPPSGTRRPRKLLRVDSRRRLPAKRQADMRRSRCRLSRQKRRSRSRPLPQPAAQRDRDHHGSLCRSGCDPALHHFPGACAPCRAPGEGRGAGRRPLVERPRPRAAAHGIQARHGLAHQQRARLPNQLGADAPGDRSQRSRGRGPGRSRSDYRSRACARRPDGLDQASACTRRNRTVLVQPARLAACSRSSPAARGSRRRRSACRRHQRHRLCRAAGRRRAPRLSGPPVGCPWRRPIEELACAPRRPSAGRQDHARSGRRLLCCRRVRGRRSHRRPACRLDARSQRNHLGAKKAVASSRRKEVALIAPYYPETTPTDLPSIISEGVSTSVQTAVAAINPSGRQRPGPDFQATSPKRRVRDNINGVTVATPPTAQRRPSTRRMRSGRSRVVMRAPTAPRYRPTPMPTKSRELARWRPQGQAGQLIEKAISMKALGVDARI